MLGTLFRRMASPLIEALVTWLQPHTITELRSFLDFCGYYHHFVKGFSTLCQPLNELLQGCRSQGKKKRVSSQANDTKPCFRPAEPFGPPWSDQCESAFQELKIRLMQAPVQTPRNHMFCMWMKAWTG